MKKKLISTSLLIVLLSSLVGCETINIGLGGNSSGNSNNFNDVNTINIINVNDVHGAIMETSYNKSMASLKYQIDQIENQDNIKNTLVIGNGDMLQGTAISNMSKGETVINTMNAVGFDVLGIGNHEFDWGIDEFLKYFDGNKTNGESTATLVNSNLYYEDSGELLEHSVPYKVFDYGFIKVGVVSYAPPSIKDSILAKRTQNIDFRSLEETCPRTIAACKKAGADIIVANVHQGGKVNDEVNYTLARYGANAILDGHQHKSYSGLLGEIPVVQCRDSLKQDLGLIELKIKNRKIISASAKNVTLPNAKDRNVQQVIDEEYNKYKDEINRELCTVKGNYQDKVEYARWSAKLMNEVVDADVSLINKGAIRNISYTNDRKFTIGGVYSLLPFDNEVVVFKMTGKEIKDFPYPYGVYELDKKYGSFAALDDATVYDFAIIDYVAYKYPTLFNNEYQTYPVIFRDMIIDELSAYGENNVLFNPNNDFIFTSNKL